MKKNKIIYLIIFLVIIIIVLVQFSEPDLGKKISNIVTLLAAFTGLISVIFEMKKSNDVATSTYILELQKFFQTTPKIQNLYRRLDEYYENKSDTINSDDRDKMVSYLTFLEQISTLVLKGTLSIVDIDNIFFYVYFVCIKNPSVQKIELSKNLDYYQNTITIYKQLIKYRKSKNKPVPLDDTYLYNMRQTI